MLTVTDSSGSSASDTAVVRVADRPPVANAGPDQSGIQGSAVTFRASGSDQDGTVTSYTWNFGDGASAAGATASHAYATAGTYTAQLTVTADRGALGSDSALVTVAGSPGGTPWARGFGGAASDVGYGVAVDASGNAVMTGRVESTVNFGGGVVCPPAAVFVSKYSPTGATMWSKCLGGVLGGGTGRAVAVDGSSNVLVTGQRRGGGPERQHRRDRRVLGHDRLRRRSADQRRRRHLPRQALAHRRPPLVPALRERTRHARRQWRRVRRERERARDGVVRELDRPRRGLDDELRAQGRVRREVLAGGRLSVVATRRRPLR